jgi:hypothetical protein
MEHLNTTTHCSTAERWTRAAVASKMGKWGIAKTLWSDLLHVYRQSDSPAHNEMARECLVQMNRATLYMEKNTPPVSMRIEPPRPLRGPKATSGRPKAKQKGERINNNTISNNTVGEIMDGFHKLANANDIIQRSITPPCLQESFYMVQRASPNKRQNDMRQQLIKAKSDLKRLRATSQSSFNNVKKALEGLSPQTVYLFPEKLISNYTVLKRENNELKKIMNERKTP